MNNAMIDLFNVFSSMTLAMAGAIWGWLSYRLKRIEAKIESLSLRQAECTAATSAKIEQLDDVWREIEKLNESLIHHTHNGEGRYVPRK